MTARRGGYWSAVVASVAVLVAGVVLALTGDQRPSGADGVVRAYFAALSRADAPAALALGIVPAGTHAFLTSAVLRLQQDLAPLSDVHIDAVDGTDRLRTVHYSYVLGFPGGARTVTGAVDVAPGGGTWHLTRTAVPVHLELSGATSRATLAGAAVPDGTVALFPGAVPVRFDTPELAVPNGAVTFGAPAEVSLDVGLSAAGRATLRAAVESRLRTCFPVGGTAAPECPLPDDPRIVPGSLHGTVDAGGIAELDLAVESLASGPVRVDGTLAFSGSYLRLDDDNIAQERTGKLTLRVRAVTDSVGPVRLRFEETSS